MTMKMRMGDMELKEEWKDVVGFEEYFKVSSFGQVFSKRTNKILKQHLNDQGRKVLATRIGGRAGQSYCFKIHRLVAEAFIENPEAKPEVNHKDGDKLNNSVSNLEWNTREENVEHARDNNLFLGCLQKGVDNPLSSLTQEQVDYIKMKYKARCKIYGCRALSKYFGVSHSVISLIVNNKRYY